MAMKPQIRLSYQKNPTISMCATKPFIDLTYEHHKVEVKQISYEFNR